LKLPDAQGWSHPDRRDQRVRVVHVDGIFQQVRRHLSLGRLLGPVEFYFLTTTLEYVACSVLFVTSKDAGCLFVSLKVHSCTLSQINERTPLS